MIKFGIRVNGVEELRRRVANVADCAISGAVTRRGLSEVGRIVTRQQKAMAPVRKGRLVKRELHKRLARGMEIGKAVKLSTVPVLKTRGKRLAPGVSGPEKFIKPGLVKRSIGYRVARGKGSLKGSLVLKMGMNVGKKRSNNNFAPHAAFVGVGTQQRYAFRPKANQIGPNKINRGIMPQNRFINDGMNVAAVSAMAALDKAVKEDMVRAYQLSLRASRVVS
jgi:hypothetical protein